MLYCLYIRRRQSNCSFVKISVNEIFIAFRTFCNLHQRNMSSFFSSLIQFTVTSCTQEGWLNNATSRYAQPPSVSIRGMYRLAKSCGGNASIACHRRLVWIGITLSLRCELFTNECWFCKQRSISYRLLLVASCFGAKGNCLKPQLHFYKVIR